MDAYPHVTDEQARQARLDLERDLRFGWDMWAWARLQAQSGRNSVYFYYFEQKPPFPKGPSAKVGGRATSPSCGTCSIIWIRTPGAGPRQIETGQTDVRLLDEFCEARRSERRRPAALATL